MKRVIYCTMTTYCYLFLLYAANCGMHIQISKAAVVINTWNFDNANAQAWRSLKNGATAVDAIEVGCTTCENEQCDHTVGYGGSPDENGECTLDAMIFDGKSMDMGAVGGLRRIPKAISTARKILELTEHSFLVGDLATAFASRYYSEQNLSSTYSSTIWAKWHTADKCQPNFWRMSDDPNPICHKTRAFPHLINIYNHDTIGMISVDQYGNIAAGTSSNGAKFKIPGRVGDAPIAGAGAYAENDVGAAVATGDGDIMMRFLPTFLAVERIRQGDSAVNATQIAINRIRAKYPKFFGAVIAYDARTGDVGAACNGMAQFPYCISSEQLNNRSPIIRIVNCQNAI